MSESLVFRSFSGGEISPAIEARADLPKRTVSARTVRNMIVLKSGAIANRPGFSFIDTCKDNNSGKFLFKFLADDPNESILIEAGNSYLRFYKDGAQVQVLTSGVTAWSNATAYTVGDLASRSSVVYYCILAHTNQQPPNATYWYALVADGLNSIYEIPTPFTAGFYRNQSGPLVTLTKQGFAPRELVYVSLTRWVVQAPTFAPTPSAPTNLTATGGTASPQTNQTGYVVTAAAPGTFEESLPSTGTHLSFVPSAAAPIILEFDGVTVGGVACPEYYVYRDQTKSNTYEFISACKTNASGSGGKVLFLDVGFTQDPAITPPINDLDLTSSNNQPAVSAFHQQRRFFANTVTTPDAVYGSKVGQRSNFTRSSPLQDDDALSFRIAQNQNHAVRHIISVAAGMIVFTAGGEHRVISGQGAEGPLTPTSLDPIQDLYVGAAADVVPEVMGNSTAYVQARGKIARDVQFDQAIEGLAGRDLTILASHLFEAYTLTGMAYQQNDNSILWFVRSDGTLLGLTYIREQDIWGWHRHDTRTAAAVSVIESIAVVPEDTEDVLYAVIARSISGGTVRYIERLESRVITTLATDAIFMDAVLSYLTGSPISAVTGLSHLEGQVVGAVGDGVYLGTFTVASGSITLSATATYSKVHVGLLYTSDLETLNLDEAQSGILDKQKRVSPLSMLVDKSNRQFTIGIDTATLTQYTPGEADDPTNGEFSGLIQDAPLLTDHNWKGRVFIRQATPLPLTILAVIPSVQVGG